MQPTLIGIKNRSGEDQIFCFDGQPIFFKKDQVRVLESAAGSHALKQVVIKHKRDEKGGLLPAIVGHQLFESLPLHEALKVATLEENPDVVSARKKMEEKAAEKKALMQEVMAELKEQGLLKEPVTAKGGKNEKN